MTNHFTVRELYRGCRLILSSGVHVVTDVEPSNIVPENAIVHVVGGSFECDYNTEFVSVKPGTFRALR